MDIPPANQWKTLDKDLRRLGFIEQATQVVAKPLVAPGLALAFIVLAGTVAALATGFESRFLLLVAASAVGAYMALNIGANDVGSYMGAPVGAGALPLGMALVIAAICEVAGALIAGGAVVETLSHDIVDPVKLAQPDHLVWVMLAALLAAAAWLHFATWVGATVSTTHSIIGGIIGAGLAAGGLQALMWSEVGLITAGWIASPIIGGFGAAASLAFLRIRISEAEDKVAAARYWVPILLGVICGCFMGYLLIKGPGFRVPTALTYGAICGLLTWGLWRPIVRRQSEGLENKRKSVRHLFDAPLITSAALMSFAHGANDISNAIGPVAAIVDALGHTDVRASGGAPFWVMLVGAFGISLGLLLFGPRLIRLVGSEITKLNGMRAFSVSLSTGTTVIAASALGLPVSTTHIAVGGIFGVGLYREWHESRAARAGRGLPVPPEERDRRRLVRRSHMLTLSIAWIVTLPVTALLAAGLFVAMALIAT